MTITETASTRDMRQFVGWFDDPAQTEPVYRPPFPGPCIVCMKPMLNQSDVRVTCLMWQDRKHGLSVFYRMHRTCAESLTPDEMSDYDGVVLDSMPTLVAPTSPVTETANG